ncbi:IS701 family transposase [Streptomyces sp. H27-D2]|uniref:IS701 family transposase n=1 Tax=Streptomyces sp. H27-D2 TaxID=3046304 RepID=UPI003FA6FF5E
MATRTALATLTAQTTQARPSVSAFTEAVFGRLPRADQRKWAHAYLHGLLTTPGKKTVRRLAASVSDSSTAAQALHQFVNDSPWEWAPVRDRLARWVQERTRPRAVTIGPAVLPKRGEQSCGVHRRFVPQSGRTVNCQVGIGAFLSTGADVVPVDWRLLLPEHWSQDPQSRRRARIPDTEPGDRQGSATAHALDLVDGIGARRDLAGLPVVVDLTGYSDSGEAVRGLAARGRRFVVALPGSHPVLPIPSGPSVQRRRPEADKRRLTGDGHALPVQRLLGQHSPRQPRTAGQPAFLTGLVRLGGVDSPLRVFAESPAPGRVGQIWITDLVHRPPGELLDLARLHAGTADTLERLENDFGLRAFEGRSFPGWHHHMTLVSAAFAYSSLSRGVPASPLPASPLPAASLPPAPPPPAPLPTLTRTGCNR